MGSLFSDIGSGIESTYDYLKSSLDDGSTVPEYDPETGEPLNDAAKKAVADYEREYEGGTKADKVAEAAEAVGKVLGAKGPEVLAKGGTAPLPGVPAPLKGYAATKSPYAAPSYLSGSVDYNKMVGNLVAGLLKQRIRSPKISSLL